MINKQTSRSGKKQQIIGVFLACISILGLLAACGETSSPTVQPGAIATPSEAPTTNTTLAATTLVLPTVTPVAASVAATTAATTTDVPTTLATTIAVVPTTAATTTDVVTTIATTTVAPSTTTVAPTKPAITIAPVTTTSIAVKSGTSQSRAFSEKDNNSTLQLNVGDTLLAQLKSDLDWSFQVLPDNGVLSAPTPAAAPYEDSFKALAPGTVQIKAFGRCHPVPGQVCFQAIITQLITVNVS